MVGGDDSPIGLDAARLDHGNVDAERLQFHPQGIAQRLHRILGNMVPATEIHHDLSCHGRDVDDTAAPLRPHGRKHQLAQAGQTEHIDFQLPTGFLQRHILNGAEVAVAGIVHEDVDAAFRLQDRPDTRLHGGIVRHVHPQRNHAERLERFHTLHAPGRRIHTVPLLCKRHSGIEPDAAARACNQYDFFHFERPSVISSKVEKSIS